MIFIDNHLKPSRWNQNLPLDSMDYKCLSSNDSKMQSKYFVKYDGLTIHRIDDFKNNQDLTDLAQFSK